ncbi:MAG: hypothetical protein A2252_08610 [Elusimicrobia bacterium RIFOXYA2_FULL_39_19]|nr:MAG: hypothetical protein A2252_08610 [Elusimicrobia bacterium RIFOXYA2_FULL_39_19]
MNFAVKIYLYLGVIVFPAFIFALVYYHKKYLADLNAFSEKKMFSVIFDTSVLKARKTKNILLMLAVFFLIISLAGPQFGTRFVNINRKSIDIIIAIDCSKSMLAEDVYPNRMAKAKDMFSILIDRLKENRIGVIAFSGTAFTQCPLTFDYNAAKMLLEMINTNLIPYPGTKMGDAIKLAVKSFGEGNRSNKVIILLTDGEDHKSDPAGAARLAKEQGIRIYTIGIGSAKGEVIPLRDSNGNVTEYKKDKSGQVVASKLDEGMLMDIASATGGKYFSMATVDTGVAEQLVDELSGIEKKDTKGGIYNLYEHRYQYTLFIAIILLLLEMVYPERKTVVKLTSAIKR